MKVHFGLSPQTLKRYWSKPDKRLLEFEAKLHASFEGAAKLVIVVDLDF
jgi:hypothetical protein